MAGLPMTEIITGDMPRTREAAASENRDDCGVRHMASGPVYSPRSASVGVSLAALDAG